MGGLSHFENKIMESRGLRIARHFVDQAALDEFNEDRVLVKAVQSETCLIAAGGHLVRDLKFIEGVFGRFNPTLLVAWLIEGLGVPVSALFFQVAEGIGDKCRAIKVLREDHVEPVVHHANRYGNSECFCSLFEVEFLKL